MLALFLIFVVILCVFLALAFFTMPLYAPPRSAVSTSSTVPGRSLNGLPWIPQTVAQARAMDPTDFEYLSAALVMAQGNGYSFYRHTGKSGDQGIDAKLLNVHSLSVVIQSKRYGDENHVEPSEVLSFWGAIKRHDAIYGYFITTSTFSTSAWQILRASRGLIHAIDENQLAWLLQQRSHEIALAYSDVLRQVEM